MTSPSDVSKSFEHLARQLQRLVDDGLIASFAPDGDVPRRWLVVTNDQREHSWSTAQVRSFRCGVFAERYKDAPREEVVS